MSKILVEIYSLKHIGTTQFAKTFFSILEKYRIIPDKIGSYEPLKKVYTLEDATKIWMDASDTAPDFRMGTIICKKKNPNVREDVMWHIGEKARVNCISIWFTKKSFNQCRGSVEDLFKELIMTTNSFYGFITDYKPRIRQDHPGTIEYRLPGIFWCNFFGEFLTNYLGKDKIVGAPWFKTEWLGQHGILAYLSKEPDDEELIDSPALENNIKEFLGKEPFGDVDKKGPLTYDEWNTINDKIEHKNLLKLDFSEIRKPISSFNLGSKN